MAIAHFGFGASMTAIVVLYLLPAVRYERSIVLVGGGWGMIPDAHWVIPIFGTEIYTLHNSVAADIFWLHRTLDKIDTGDSRAVGALMLGLFIGVSFVVERWDYAQLERDSEGAASIDDPLRSLRLLSDLASVAGIISGSVFVLYTLQLRTGRGLFLGIGTALIVSGVYGLTTDERPRFRAERRWVQQGITGGLVVLCVVGTIGGLTLLATPLHAGRSVISVSYAGLGCLLLVQTTLLARRNVTTPQA